MAGLTGGNDRGELGIGTRGAALLQGRGCTEKTATD